MCAKHETNVRTPSTSHQTTPPTKGSPGKKRLLPRGTLTHGWMLTLADEAPARAVATPNGASQRGRGTGVSVFCCFASCWGGQIVHNRLL
jgi:hypothetical protein